MKVLAVTNTYPSPDRPFFGTFIEQQVKGLQAIGIAVDVLFVDRRRDGAKVYWTLRRALHRRIEELSPDLVHVMYGGVMAQRVTMTVRSRPVIVSFCGSDLLGERLPGLLRQLMANAGVRASRNAALSADGVIVKSRNLLEALPEGVDSKRVRIIPNGIDLDRFKPMDPEKCRAQLGWDPDRFHVLFPANTGAPLKRLWLAKAAVERAYQMGLVPELHLLQGVPHRDVPLWINASDVLLLTSEHEGSPNVVKEALACDVPVVSVDVGDVAERLAGIDGCIITTTGPEDIANGLFRVSKLDRRIQGRARISELSLTNVARRVSDFYQETLGVWNTGGKSCSDRDSGSVAMSAAAG